MSRALSCCTLCLLPKEAADVHRQFGASAGLAPGGPAPRQLPPGQDREHGDQLIEGLGIVELRPFLKIQSPYGGFPESDRAASADV